MLNVGLEGMMLMGAVTAYLVAYNTGNAWMGLLAAIGVGGLMALLHAFMTVTLRADQVVSGLALALLGSGMSAVIGAPLVEVRTAPRLPEFPIPVLSNIPVLGPIFFDHNVIVYIGLLSAPIAWWYIYRTRPGMELRSIGEYPAAADVLGINVIRQRYLYVILGGMLAGLGGAALSLAITPLWIEDMTAGQGWIALGLVIFAGWDPLRAAFGSYLFGAIRRLPLDAQNLPLFLSAPAAGLFYEHAALPVCHHSHAHQRTRQHAAADRCPGRSRPALRARRTRRIVAGTRRVHAATFSCSLYLAGAQRRPRCFRRGAGSGLPHDRPGRDGA